jgi:CubicO group peptidase (beta-lactamase class C family)
MMGEMVRNGGKFGSKQVVPANWIAQSTTILPTDAEVTKDVISLDFRAEKMNYKCFWWIWGKDGLPNDFTGIGLHGQYIYISPRNHTVVVRTGKSWGRFGSTRWLDLMHDIAHSVPC